jgi:hypothetical protein
MRRLATPGWLLCHVAAIAIVVTFLRLGWWQLSRAEGGNGLSIGYTLEWPLFAAFVVVIWLREVRGTLRANRPESVAPATEKPEQPVPDGVSRFDPVAERAARAARSAAGDPDSAYNQYLTWLAEHPYARPGDYRRPMPPTVMATADEEIPRA